MKKLTLLSKISIVLSILLVATGIWEIVNEKDFLNGFGCIGLAFAVSINDWNKLFNRDK